jgi:muramoyltetrapeptide carboxypeptidase
MITPPYLVPGDTVGIIAPARKVEPSEIEGFTGLLGEWGLKCKPGKNLFGEYNQYSGTDEQRAADLRDMIADPQVKAVFAARGGYGSMRTLRLTDFSKFEKNPKWIAGFSDITAFHVYLNHYLNTESLHCMMPFNYRKDDSEIAESAESLRKALFGDDMEYSFAPSAFNRVGKTKAELTGGNLSILYSINGTPFFPDLRGKILFIEDIDEYLYHIDRMMQNLLISGALHNIKGLLIGGFTDIRDNTVPFGRTSEEIISEAAAKFRFPVAFSFPAGHIKRNMTLIFGRQMQLSVNANQAKVAFVKK